MTTDPGPYTICQKATCGLQSAGTRSCVRWYWYACCPSSCTIYRTCIWFTIPRAAKAWRLIVRGLFSKFRISCTWAALWTHHLEMPVVLWRKSSFGSTVDKSLTLELATLVYASVDWSDKQHHFIIIWITQKCRYDDYSKIFESKTREISMTEWTTASISFCKRKTKMYVSNLNSTSEYVINSKILHFEVNMNWT